MNLFRESVDAARWVGSVTRAFFRVRPWTTSALVVSITTDKIASMLAFFLPLKVILLAGSDGVPRYFRFFIEPDDKMPWIIGLSAGAVGFYILSLAMDAVSKRLAEAGSSEVLQGANEIAVASKQREEAQGYYRRFSGISANLLLGLIMFGVLGLLNPLLISVLLALIVGQYLFTAGVLHFGNPLSPGPTLRMIRRNLGGYLTIFSSVDFLTGFFVLLAPFLLGTGGNLLIAILSILLLRQGLGAVSGIVTGTSGLWKKRREVDPMVFRDRQMQKREQLVLRNLRQVFSKPKREAVVAGQLAAADVAVEGLSSEWRDSVIRGVYTFQLHVPKTADRPAGHYQQQVFPRGQLHLLEHEEFLFQHLSRETLFAPAVLARFADGPFECQVLDYGRGKACDGDTWKELSVTLMRDMWSFEPPRSLVSAFNTSRPTLEGRLVPDFLERLEVALDRPAEQKAYEELMENLPLLEKILATIPVYIYNPDMIRANVVVAGGGRPQVMSWGRWAIEPIGAELPKTMNDRSIRAALEEVREHRGLAQDAVDVTHLRLANDCREFEREIVKGRYNRAIVRMRRVLKNQLVKEHS